MYHNFTSTALCHLTSLSKIMVQWCIFSGSNALRKPSPLLNKPQSLKKPNINHQDPIYNATTQVSSPAQLRGQFAILQGQQEHLKMTLQKNPEENTQKKEKKPHKIKPNQTPKPILYWTTRTYCSQGPQVAAWELAWRLLHTTVMRGMVRFCCLRPKSKGKLSGKSEQLVKSFLC